MMSRCASVAVLVVCLGVGLTAAAERLELVDQTGTSIWIEQPVERIVSVYGMGTYYLYALGTQDRLVGGGYVGVKSVAQASEALRRLEPRLDELFVFGDPNAEEILLRNPDLVLADGSRHEAFAEQMSDLNIPTLQYLVESSQELRDALGLTALALGADAQARADAFGQDFDRVVSTIASDLTDLPEEMRVRVLFLGTEPQLVASGDMYQSELIERAGGRNAADALFGYWNEVNLEQIILWDPDVIVIAPYGPVQPQTLLANADWAAIRAVRDGRVHRMPRLIAPMDTPVPESILGVVWMTKVFYPDLVTLDPVEESVGFYQDYYGLTLTDEEKELLTLP